MALDDTYGFVYCGTAGLGVGIFNLNGDQIIGCDYGGGRYTGTAIEDSTGRITVDATVHIARHRCSGHFLLAAAKTRFPTSFWGWLASTGRRTSRHCHGHG